VNTITAPAVFVGVLFGGLHDGLDMPPFSSRCASFRCGFFLDSILRTGTARDGEEDRMIMMLGDSITAGFDVSKYFPDLDW